MSFHSRSEEEDSDYMPSEERMRNYERSEVIDLPITTILFLKIRKCWRNNVIRLLPSRFWTFILVLQFLLLIIVTTALIVFIFLYLDCTEEEESTSIFDDIKNKLKDKKKSNANVVSLAALDQSWWCGSVCEEDILNKGDYSGEKEKEIRFTGLMDSCGEVKCKRVNSKENEKMKSFFDHPVQGNL